MVKDEDIGCAIDTLCSFIKELSLVQPLLLPRDMINLDSSWLRAANENSKRALMEMCGFNIEVRRSFLKDGGEGVFVSRGTVRKGQLVALYPGTASLLAL